MAEASAVLEHEVEVMVLLLWLLLWLWLLWFVCVDTSFIDQFFLLVFIFSKKAQCLFGNRWNYHASAASSSVNISYWMR
jgi:hypothetical protein